MIFLSFFLEDYKLDEDFKFWFDFKLAFQSIPNLFASGLFGIVFEHLQNSFHLENSTSGFS
jgi:hypothetical protein